MRWNELVAMTSGWAGANSWIGQIFVVVFIALCIDLIQRRLLVRLHKKLSKTDNPWDDSLV